MQMILMKCQTLFSLKNSNKKETDCHLAATVLLGTLKVNNIGHYLTWLSGLLD